MSWLAVSHCKIHLYYGAVFLAWQTVQSVAAGFSSPIRVWHPMHC